MRKVIKRNLHRQMNEEFKDLPLVVTNRDLITHEVSRVAIILPYSEELEKQFEGYISQSAEKVADEYTATPGSGIVNQEPELENTTSISPPVYQEENAEISVSKDTEDIEKIAKNGWSPNLLSKFFKK